MGCTLKKGIKIILTTIDDEAKANEFSKKLVGNKLAACVSMLKIKSTYFWAGKIEESWEFLLFIKTHSDKLKDVVDWIRENHPYNVPEIIILDSLADEPYYQWLTDYILK